MNKELKRWTPVKTKTNSVVSVPTGFGLKSPDSWPALPSHNPPPYSNQAKSIQLSISAENVNWLERSLIGVLKRVEFIPEIQDKVAELEWKCEARVLGIGLACLEFDSLTELEKDGKNIRDGVKKLLYKVFPWKDMAFESGRCIWIQCSVIPMQSWGTKTFKAISSTIGDFVTIDYNTLLRRRMDVAKILVNTTHKAVDCSITSNLNGVEYLIRCKEEPLLGIVSNFDWLAGTRAYEDSCEDVSKNNEKTSTKDIVMDCGLSRAVKGFLKDIIYKICKKEAFSEHFGSITESAKSRPKPDHRSVGLERSCGEPTELMTW